jgi:MerR-like DNA binding protein
VFNASTLSKGSSKSGRSSSVLTIGQLAEQTGVAATALRYYDELGLHSVGLSTTPKPHAPR